MNQTRYPSAQEIEKRLATELGKIRAQTVYAEYAEPATAPIHYRSVVGEKGMAANQSANLLADHFRLMRSIRDNPQDGLRRHYDRIGVGIEKGNRLISDLKQAACVEVRPLPSAAPKGGRARLVPSLTERGRQLLCAYEQQFQAKSNEA